MKVLVAEDDENIRNGLCDILGDEGYTCIPARNGAEALRLVASENPDLVCLDIMMPGRSGYDVCREVRSRDSTVPIIFITAKSEEVDKVLGLELGADDFIVKPFGVREVVARVRAVTRRCIAARGELARAATTGAGISSSNAPPSGLASPAFQMLDLRVIPAELRAARGNKVIELSLRDVMLLQLFERHRGKVLDRFTLFSEIWGLSHLPNSRTLDQHIAQLRKRIERDPKNPEIILTVHGVGYRYNG